MNEHQIEWFSLLLYGPLFLPALCTPKGGHCSSSWWGSSWGGVSPFALAPCRSAQDPDRVGEDLSCPIASCLQCLPERMRDTWVPGLADEYPGEVVSSRKGIDEMFMVALSRTLGPQSTEDLTIK